MDGHAISVVIPALNEEKYIGKCLRAVKSAAKYVYPDTVEIIVVANRCTDRTARIAEHCGARVIREQRQVHKCDKKLRCECC